MRSKWKFVPINRLFLKQIIIESKSFVLWKKKKFLKVFSKGFRLFNALCEKKISTYNGFKFITVFIKKNMLGHFLGEFILTKRISSEIHKVKKRNSKKKK